MSNTEKQYTDEWHIRFFYGHLAWSLMKEMWMNNSLDIPGLEEYWEEVSRVAENRPVTAVNPEAAVNCARKNTVLNNVADKITVRQSDRTCLLKDERFDIIAANPPLLPVSRYEERPLASAVFDPDSHATIEFIKALPDHLTSNGRCYLLTSSTFDRNGRNMYSLSEQNGLTAQLVAAAPRQYEWYRIHQIRLANKH